MAKLVTSRFCGKALDLDTLKGKLAATTRPSNCPTLCIPRINREINEGFPLMTRQRDANIMMGQRSIIAAASLVANLTQDVVDTKVGNAPDIVKKAADALSLLNQASREMSVYRRQLIRPHLNAEYASLCGPSAEMSSSWLFGDDLAKTQRDLAATSRLTRFTRGFSSGSFSGRGGRGFAGRGFSGRGFSDNFRRGQSTTQSRGFLGRGSRGSWRPPRGNFRK